MHGNLPGLEAILADIERRGVPQTISLGDLVGYGPSPNEVALLVRDRGIPSLMGNYDQGIGFETGDCGCVYKTDEQRAEGAVSLEWTQEAVTDEVKAYLRTLEDHFTFATPAGDLLAVHGSPRRINEYLFEDRPASGHGAHGRRVSLPGHLLRPHARALRAAGRRDHLRQRRQRRAPQGRRLARLLRASSTRRGSARPGFVEFVRVPYDYERLQRELAATPLITSFAGPTSAGS